MDVHDRFSGPIIAQPAITRSEGTGSLDRLTVLPGVTDETSEDTPEVTPRNNNPAVTVASARQAANAATTGFMPKLGGAGRGVLADMEEVVAAPSAKPSAVAPASKPPARMAVSAAMDTFKQVDAVFTEASKRQEKMGVNPQTLSEEDLHALPEAMRDEYRSRLDAFKSAEGTLLSLVGTLPKNLGAQFVDVKGTIGYKLSKSMKSAVAAEEKDGAYGAIEKFKGTAEYKKAKADFQEARDKFRGVMRNADSFLTVMTALKCFSKAGSEAENLADLNKLPAQDLHTIEKEIMLYDPDEQGKEEKKAIFGVLTHALVHPEGLKIQDVRSQMLERSLMESARCIKSNATPFQTDCGAITSFSRQWREIFNQNGIRRIIGNLIDLMSKNKLDVQDQKALEKLEVALLEVAVSSIEAKDDPGIKNLGRMMKQALAQLQFKNEYVKSPAAYTVAIFFLRIINPQLAHARANILDKSMMPQCMQIGKSLQTRVNSYSQNPDAQTPVKPLFDRLAKALTGSAPGDEMATAHVEEAPLAEEPRAPAAPPPKDKDELSDDEFNAYL